LILRYLQMAEATQATPAPPKGPESSKTPIRDLDYKMTVIETAEKRLNAKFEELLLADEMKKRRAPFIKVLPGAELLKSVVGLVQALKLLQMQNEKLGRVALQTEEKYADLLERNSEFMTMGNGLLDQYNEHLSTIKTPEQVAHERRVTEAENKLLKQDVDAAKHQMEEFFAERERTISAIPVAREEKLKAEVALRELKQQLSIEANQARSSANKAKDEQRRWMIAKIEQEGGPAAAAAARAKFAAETEDDGFFEEGAAQAPAAEEHDDFFDDAPSREAPIPLSAHAPVGGIPMMNPAPSVPLGGSPAAGSGIAMPTHAAASRPIMMGRRPPSRKKMAGTSTSGAAATIVSTPLLPGAPPASPGGPAAAALAPPAPPASPAWSPSPPAPNPAVLPPPPANSSSSTPRPEEYALALVSTSTELTIANPGAPKAPSFTRQQNLKRVQVCDTMWDYQGWCVCILCGTTKGGVYV
jgi:hypothetical protein